jgi:uncharacterized protein YecE (DUF72 family)
MKQIPVSAYVRVVQLPFSNHERAKVILNQAMETKKKIKVPRKDFNTTRQNTMRHLFNFTFRQMNWYCPADKIEVKFSEKDVIVRYVCRQQYYKGIEEL